MLGIVGDVARRVPIVVGRVDLWPRERSLVATRGHEEIRVGRQATLSQLLRRLCVTSVTKHSYTWKSTGEEEKKNVVRLYFATGAEHADVVDMLLLLLFAANGR